MKVLPLLGVLIFMGLSTAHANQCKSTQAEAKQLEVSMEGVNFATDKDSGWKAIRSLEPANEVSEAEIKRVLQLESNKEYNFFEMSKSNDVYDFLEYEIDINSPSNDGDPEIQKKLESLKQYISEKYGENARLILNGQSEIEGHFYGDYMIILIQENGCVLGLKADASLT